MKTAHIPNAHPFSEAGSNSPDLIVIHAMGEFIDTDDQDYPAWDFLSSLKLSAHAFVTPSGVVVRSKPDDRLAWHAKGFNTDSLGVEFLVPGLHTYETFLDTIKRPWLTDAQFEAGVKLVRSWREKWNISPAKVLRHSDISPRRKHDPGDGFPWRRFINEL